MPARSAGESGATARMIAQSFGSVRKPSHPGVADVAGLDVGTAAPGILLRVLGALLEVLGALLEVLAALLWVLAALVEVLGALPEVLAALVEVLAAFPEVVGACFAGGASFVAGCFAGTFTGSC